MKKVHKTKPPKQKISIEEVIAMIHEAEAEQEKGPVPDGNIHVSIDAHAGSFLLFEDDPDED